MSSNNNKQPLDLTYSSPVFDKTLGFLLDCAERGENRHNQPSPSIYKVSRILRDLSESSFIPELVSIGPTHRENKKLKEFEWPKECYLNSLLSRCYHSTPKERLEACLLKVNTSIHQIRKSYAGVKNYSDVDLAMMMVIDGYIILEFCFKHEDEHSDLPNNMQTQVPFFVSSMMQTTRIAMDLMLLENQVPFFVLQALFDCLAPYIFKKNVTLSQVLDTHLAPYIMLFRETNSTTDVDSHLPEKISSIDVDSDSTPAHVDSDSTPAHVLGYLHKLYQPVAAKSSEPKDAEASRHADEEQAAKSSEPKHTEASKHADEEQAAKSLEPKHAEASKLVDEEQAAKSSEPKHAEASKIVDEEQAVKSLEPKHAEASKLADEEQAAKSSYPIEIHSIVELDRSGMNFKPHQEDEWSMTIKFQPSLFPWSWSKPTLLMPTLVIDDTTELILRNFIAYEQSFPQGRYYFTSYAHAMSMLIDTQEDIAKLVESKVLLNALGSNQEVADMINKICKNISIPDFYYTQEFKQVDKYYNGYWGKYRRIYFSNPWNAINLLVGIIVFLATVVSAIVAVLEYFP